MNKVSVDDRVLIRDLYDLFFMALNEGDAETVRNCFAPGGHVTRFNGEKVSPEGPAQTGRKWSQDEVGRTYQHHVTNVVVEPDPHGRDDYRRVKMYFLVTGVWDPPTTIVRWSCKSVDELQLVDGEWKFYDRYVTLNHDSTGPHWGNEPTHADAG